MILFDMMFLTTSRAQWAFKWNFLSANVEKKQVWKVIFPVFLHLFFPGVVELLPCVCRHCTVHCHHLQQFDSSCLPNFCGQWGNSPWLLKRCCNICTRYWVYKTQNIHFSTLPLSRITHGKLDSKSLFFSGVYSAR